MWYTGPMRSADDKAIILRRQPFGEADVLLVVYTEKHGKLRVVAKGARRINSRLLGYTEPLTIVACRLNFGGQIPIISQVTHVRLYDGLAQNWLLFEQLNLVAELIDRGCEEGEANSALFRLLVSEINRLATTHHPLILSALLVRIVTVLGFAPQLTICARCGKHLDSNVEMSWSNAQGGIVCCRGDLYPSLPLNEARVLRFVARANADSVQLLRVPATLAKSVEARLLDHIQYTLERELRVVRVMEQSAHENVG